MKLRQKLAVVLASAMVVTAVPVITMAASTSYVSKVITASKDSSFETNLIIDVKDATTSTTNQVIYLELSGAKFDKDKYTGSQYDTRGGDKELAIILDKNVEKGKINIPIYAKSLSGDEVTVTIDGNATKAIDNATVVVAKKSDAKAKVTAADAKKIDGEGTVATITLEEPFKNVVQGKEVTITLENSNYKFTDAGTVTGTRGLSGVTIDPKIKDGDDQVITFTVPKDLNRESLGKLEISGIEVKCLDKEAPVEDIEVTVSGDKVTETTVTVAKVVEYGGELTASSKDVEITAGQKKDVKVKLKETLAESFTDGKTVEFTLSDGYLLEAPEGTTPVYKDDRNKKPTELIGFEYEIPKSTDKLDKEFKLQLQTELDDEGEITLTAEGSRAIGDDMTLVIATVNPSVKVEVTPVVVKSGIKDQTGGKLVITETAKGNIKTGTFQIELQDGAQFTDKAKFEVTSGDLIIDKIELDKTTKSILNVTVKRASKTASTIEITDFAINANRVMADGAYDVKIKDADEKGTTVGQGSLEVEGFLLVGETNMTGTASFKIGELTYTVNGETVAMDAAPYIADGRTMVPVKYVAAALGVAPSDILWDQAAQTVTIFADRTVQLKVGSNTAVVNGAAIAIDGKAVVKDGRTYVPVSSVGNLLGVKASWDNTTKTATFTR